MYMPVIKSEEHCERMAARRKERHLLRCSRKAAKLDRAAQLILCGASVNNWYGAEQLAAMKLPGLPTSDRGMRCRAQKEKWDTRQVRGQGGKKGIKTEYFMPLSYRTALATQPQIAEEVAVPIESASEPAAPAPGIVMLTLTVSLTEAAYITGWLAEQVKK
jgi:hypothetical protein